MIYPCLWFYNQAEEAAEYYCSIFSGGEILDKTPYSATFRIRDTTFLALNGNNQSRFSNANSYIVECETQIEIDYYWQRLGENGLYEMSGWLRDRYGIAWQIIPKELKSLLTDPAKGSQVMTELLKMKKIDLNVLNHL